MLARHRETVRTVTERLRVDAGVAFADLSDLGIDNVNKFIAYAANPETLYTVTVTRGPNRSKVSLGSNPWRQERRTHNLARMAERYGGGGHPAVAAISFRPDQLEEARSAARTLAAELRTP
jgi:nanoRNase/pAp phosphatase (c-di-AMP/oligoRNAs hydrolase)